MGIYEGVLDFKKMNPIPKRAYQAFFGQKYGCSNKKGKSYKYYGSKGISVKYGPREFISWYLDEIKKRKFKCPVVGRKDHNRDYEFGNIELIERTENTKERNKRLGNPNKQIPVVAMLHETGKVIGEYSSYYEAARTLDVYAGSIRRICIGERKQIKGYSFIHKEI